MLVLDLDLHQVNLGGGKRGRGERGRGQEYGLTRVLVVDLDVHQAFGVGGGRIWPGEGEWEGG